MWDISGKSEGRVPELFVSTQDTLSIDGKKSMMVSETVNSGLSGLDTLANVSVRTAKVCQFYQILSPF
jgi:hypothetical protein